MTPNGQKYLPIVSVAVLFMACGGSDSTHETDAVQDAPDATVATDPGPAHDLAGDEDPSDLAVKDQDPVDGDAGSGHPDLPDAFNGDSADGSYDSMELHEGVVDAWTPPCTIDEDCNDQDPCTSDSCEIPTGLCLHEPLQCDPGLDCFIGTCDEQGDCSYSAVQSDLCFSGPPAFTDDFEDQPLDQWTIIDLAENQLPGNEIIWIEDDARAHSGMRSLYLGDPEIKNFDTGKMVASAAVSSPITPSGEGPLTLVMWVWADVEDGDLWDVLSVVVKTESGDIPAWTKQYGFPMSVWTPVKVDLSAFAGSTFHISLVFNSVDDSFNDTEGLYLDDVFLLQRAPPPACTENPDCDDGVPCTEDACVDGACVHDFSSGCCSINLDCDDFDACTIDMCAEGACEYSQVADPLCCNTDWDCNDENECTSDECNKNRCEHSVLDDTGCCSSVTQCDDQDPCTLDKCADFQCSHFNICCSSDDDCDDNDPVCTNDSCVDEKCVFKPTGAPGCCTPEVVAFHFEDGGAGWEFDPPVGGVGWQVTSGGKTEYVSPTGALYYGNPTVWDFDNGAINGGTALSPPFMMQPSYPAALTAEVFMDTESSYSYDLVWFKVVSDGLPTTTVWEKNYYVTTGVFFNISANLSAWSGRTIRILIEFYTADDLINYGLGVFIDDLIVTTPCEPATCSSDGDCDDGVPASTDLCAGGICVNEF